MEDSPHLLQMFETLSESLPKEQVRYLLRQMKKEKPRWINDTIRINSLFPPFPSQAFDRFCRSVHERRRFPFSTYFAVTSACPCKCGHCSYAGRPESNLSHEELLDIVGQIKSIGTSIVGFTGGEPLMRPDLEELVAKTVPEMAAVVFSSGHGLTRHRAQGLAQAGVACVTLGVECTNATVHDTVRGIEGSFDIACQAARDCVEAGIYTAISTVAFREKIAAGELDRMYDLADSLGVHEFRIIQPVATGRMAGQIDQMLTPDEKAALKHFHGHQNRRPDGPTIACFAHLESAEMLGCGAGYHHLYVDAAGNVCPCDLTPLSFGNLREERLPIIWARMGDHFPQPRCGCLMGRIGAQIDPETESLPLPRPRSEALCPPPHPDSPVPEMYKAVFTRKKDRAPKD